MREMTAMTRTGDQLKRLGGLREKWTAELQDLIGRAPDLALHLTEALEDLDRFIAHVEATKPSDSRPVDGQAR